MFASNRMLFYGYSRSDSYVNDVRDQVMTMLEQGHRQREDALAPVLGYHIEDVTGKSDEDVLSDMAYARRHEGICILPIRTSTVSVRCEWTTFLRKLVRATSQHQRFAMSLMHKRILCLERPYAQHNARAGFEECAYALFVLAHAALSPAGARAVFDDDARQFKRRRDDYDAMIAALGQPAARCRQRLRLPGRGEIVVAFNVEDLLACAGDGSTWDLLLVAWELEIDCNVLDHLRSTRCCFMPALAYMQSNACQPPPSPLSSQAANKAAAAAAAALQKKARSRGYWDFCEDSERIYALVQACFAAEC